MSALGGRADVAHGAALDDAVALAASSIHAVLTATTEAGAREMLLVETEDALAAPPTVFAAKKLV